MKYLELIYPGDGKSGDLWDLFYSPGICSNFQTSHTETCEVGTHVRYVNQTGPGASMTYLLYYISWVHVMDLTYLRYNT